MDLRDTNERGNVVGGGGERWRNRGLNKNDFSVYDFAHVHLQPGGGASPQPRKAITPFYCLALCVFPAACWPLCVQLVFITWRVHNFVQIALNTHTHSIQVLL